MSRARPRFHRVNPVLPISGVGANLAKLTVQGTIEGQIVLNTFYFQDTGLPLSTASETNLAAAWNTNVKPAYLACLSSDYQMTQTVVAIITQPTRIPVTNSSPGSGARPAGHEPTTVAAVIARYTAIKGQSGRGRFFMPGIATADVLQSSLSAAGAVPFVALITPLTALLVAADRSWQPCLVSKRGPGGTTLAAGVYGSSAIVSHIFRFLLGTVRRRRIGRGK